VPDNYVRRRDEFASTGPVDLAAVQADEVLVDAVVWAAEEGSEELLELDIDAAQRRLSAMLLAWRREIDSPPIPELVSVERAGAALAAARRRRRRPAHLVPLAGAAACLVIACSGLALTAHSAMPNSPLWGVSTMLDGERAESVRAAATVTKDFADTRRALASGDIDQARKELADAGKALASVQPEDGRKELTVQQDMLITELQRSAPAVQEVSSLPTSPQGSPPAPPTPTPLTPAPATPAPATPSPLIAEPPTPAAATPPPPTAEPPTPAAPTSASPTPAPPQHGRPHHGRPHPGQPHPGQPHPGRPADGSTPPASSP
jgi:hypothetical protein